MLVLWTVIGGRVGYHGWTELCYVGCSWTEVSVSGSQVSGRALMESCRLQQDGSNVHTTILARAWLEEKFSGRVISLYTDRPWPAKSPVLLPPDYWLWGTCMQELRRNRPTTLQEMKNTVQGFVDSLEVEETRRAVLHLSKRALVCHHHVLLQTDPGTAQDG